jgi:hypothetical protein
MKVGCVVLTLVLLTNGCANRMAGLAAVGTGGTASCVGLFMLFASLFPPDDPSKDDSHDLHVRGTILTIGGAVLAISGAIMLERALRQDIEPPPASTPAPVSEAERLEMQRLVREEAWQLTKECAEAARHYDCGPARRNAPRVESLDADFYTIVFMRDVAIARCLAPAPGILLERDL